MDIAWDDALAHEQREIRARMPHYLAEFLNLGHDLQRAALVEEMTQLLENFLFRHSSNPFLRAMERARVNAPSRRDPHARYLEPSNFLAVRAVASGSGLAAAARARQTTGPAAEGESP